MIVQKPAILIYSRNPDQDYLREVCAGIEEEGVLYEVRQREECLDELAYLAAAESMLGVGIGIDGERIAMQMSRLPKGRNVFELDTPRFWQCRNLGANSARAVKKMPFKQLYQVAGATASPRYVITLLFLKNSVFLNKSSSF